MLCGAHVPSWYATPRAPRFSGVVFAHPKRSQPTTGSSPSSESIWVPAVNPYSTGQAMAPFIGSEMAFRGDHRTPAQIDAAGGLWAHQAQAVGAGGTAAQRDPDVHQAGPGNTTYVSCTRDLAIAKQFAGAAGYVYLAPVNAGVDYNAYRGGNALQAEVIAVQGIRLQDILAARSMATGGIEINTNFQQANMAPGVFHQMMLALAG